MAKNSSRALQLSIAFIVMVYVASMFNVAAYGRSSEDLVGAFSIQKTIKFGSSSECFGGTNEATDPLSAQNMALIDNQPPGLVSFSLEPKAVKASSPQSINLTAHIIDDQSGLSNGRDANLSTAWFVSPTGKQIANVTLDLRNLSTGSKIDGIYSGRLILPKYSETGTWRLDNLTLVDERGNRRALDRELMLKLGYPTEFLVV